MSLDTIFKGEFPLILCDNLDTVSSLSLAGISAYDIHSDTIGDIISNHKSAIMIISNPGLDRSLLRDHIMDLNVLVIPCYAFGSRTEDVVYTILNTLDIDFKDTTSDLRHLSSLYEDGNTLHIQTGNFSVSVELYNHKKMHICQDGIIENGDDVPLADLTEIALVPNVERGEFKKIGYNINGTMQCFGVCVAKDRDCHEHVHQLHNKAWSFFQTLRVSGGFPLTIVIANNEIISIKSGNGNDITHIIHNLMSEPFNLTILEYAIATNRSVVDKIDWSVNSPVNESAEGVHIGIGDGIRCPHIDLIMPSKGILKNTFLQAID